MAQNRLKVLLGFDDELITEKYKNQINFTANKIGGKPDLPSDIKLELPICPLCQLPRPLVVQIYAPLENSNYHRTLYVFACINPNCWNHSDSWVCLRVQTQEKITEIDDDQTTTTTSTNTTNNVTDWCTDADDWGGGDVDDVNNCNMNEENGNLINNIDKISDEDDESCSFDESVRIGLGNLTVDERNANSGALGGAVGRQHSPPASAEIEGDEGEVIIVDTPTYPQRDIVALLQEVTPLPQDLCCSNTTTTTTLRNRSNYFQFLPYFLSVYEENDNQHTSITISDRHVKELLQEYQQNNIDDINAINPPDKNNIGGAGGGDNESYEKTNPAHGDKMFHYFLTRIQRNPGQILRYYCHDIINEQPLLLYPVQNLPKYCSYCNCEMWIELQILPTIITKLKLITDQKTESRLEFGNILIFTCRNSCWSIDTNWRYETVVLQSETY